MAAELPIMHLSKALTLNFMLAWFCESLTVKKPFASSIRDEPASTEGQVWARDGDAGKEIRVIKKKRVIRVNFFFIGWNGHHRR